MKLKRYLALAVSILLIVTLFAGCGASKMSAGSAGGDPGLAEDGLNDSAGTAGSITPQNQKLIRTLYLYAETENMDDLLAKIEAQVAQLEGYVEARQVHNGSAYSTSRYRYASLTIRIPAEKLDGFVGQVSENSNIISNRETTEDVTLNYVATESRITALKTEEARLLELLAQAQTMEDLLLIEARLTEVRTELEEVTSQLRLYDNLVSYGTIHLELEEVAQYTEPEPETVWERIGTGFMNSLKGLGNGLTELFIFLIVSLPYLVLIGAIVVVAVLLYRRRKKKEAQDAPPPPSAK